MAVEKTTTYDFQFSDVEDELIFRFDVVEPGDGEFLVPQGGLVVNGAEQEDPNLPPGHKLKYSHPVLGSMRVADYETRAKLRKLLDELQTLLFTVHDQNEGGY